MALYDSTDITRLKALTATEVSGAAAKDTAINNMGRPAGYTRCILKNYVTPDGKKVYNGGTVTT